MYTAFDSISFISAAKEPVCIVLQCQSRPNRKRSNVKMLHEYGYRLHQFA